MRCVGIENERLRSCDSEERDDCLGWTAHKEIKRGTRFACCPPMKEERLPLGSPTHTSMASVPTSPRFGCFGRTIFLCTVTLAAIAAVSTRCFAQLTTEPASEALTNSLNSSAS